ncbi:MAG: adenylyltransferase/cytidyltransferase family protein [Patescibacteria group bacterium]|nr:adenylyltransferase/cytidyltransferase family protein [Patescibacteria group bacterium]MDE2015282.1 adenylyltransferase/cytidyltransferase family protein [Patescibacteria group bacterium]MDE2227088.1 adenylyltransferase/cytidyltransferase family protein [Patescibacteria group bacterium]
MPAKKKITKKKKVVAVSGGFDPLHIGHVRLFQTAKKLGDELVVILNNDNWLKKKKGYAFMHEEERREVIEAIKGVDRVLLTRHGVNPKDMSVSRELRRLKPHIFANGGDRNKADAANPRSPLYKDINTCKDLGIEMIFSIGHGGKIQSSSWLIAKYEKVLDKKRK